MAAGDGLAPGARVVPWTTQVPVTFHMSHVTFHLSPVVCHLSLVIFCHIFTRLGDNNLVPAIPEREIHYTR